MYYTRCGLSTRWSAFISFNLCYHISLLSYFFCLAMMLSILLSPPPPRSYLTGRRYSDRPILAGAMRCMVKVADACGRSFLNSRGCALFWWLFRRPIGVNILNSMNHISIYTCHSILHCIYHSFLSTLYFLLSSGTHTSRTSLAIATSFNPCNYRLISLILLSL